MLASSIIEIIERRHASFLEKCHSQSIDNSNEAGLVNPRIIEEYDSLMAEIEGLCKAIPNAHAPGLVVLEFPEDPSEEWILGDQGQPGG
ncbi:MAG: hypothetical protein ABSB35_26000 [Bryobacteraceae bacterium]